MQPWMAAAATPEWTLTIGLIVVRGPNPNPSSNHNPNWATVVGD